MDNNIHTLNSDNVAQILEMLLSEDEDTFNLAMDIVYRRDKNDPETEKCINKLIAVLKSNPKCDYIVMKLVAYSMTNFIKDFETNSENKTDN